MKVFFRLYIGTICPELHGISADLMLVRTLVPNYRDFRGRCRERDGWPTVLATSATVFKGKPRRDGMLGLKVNPAQSACVERKFDVFANELSVFLFTAWVGLESYRL